MVNVFSVMTFNICRDRRACWDNHGTLSAWHVRKPAILNLIETYSPDIIQLQELKDIKRVEGKPEIETIAAFLGHPTLYCYDRFIAYHTGVLWKSKGFRVLDGRAMSLGLSRNSPVPMGKDHQPGSAAFVRLCPVDDAASDFDVVSAHIAMPESYRIAETAILFGALDLTSRGRVIVGGDFNCFRDRGADEQLLPFSNCVDLSEVPVNNPVALTNRRQDVKLFPTSGTWNGFPHDFPTAPGQTGAHLDRVYFTPAAFSVKSAFVCVDSLVPGPNGELPGTVAVSDHLPVMATFEMLTPSM